MFAKKTVLFIIFVLLSMFYAGCENDVDFQGLYRPAQSGDERTFECKDKPSEGTDWNTVKEYKQTYDGSTWQPPNDDTTEYNEYASTITCQFICAIQYMWNGYNCVKDTLNLYREYTCNPKPEGKEYEWNTVSKYNQKSTDQGASYYPSDDPTTEYNASPSSTSCQYKCAEGYTWNGSICTTAASNVKTYLCNPMPNDTGIFVWNTVDRYTQESFDGGATYSPADDPDTEYNEEATTTSCRFKCAEGYSWDGSTCVYWQDGAGQYWIKNATQMTYLEAYNYCTALKGYIPTVSQMRLLIQNCADTVTNGGCTVSETCTSWATCRTANCESCSSSPGYYSIFSDTGWFWTSTQVSDQEASNYTVNFDNASINMSVFNQTYVGNVRCIK